MSTSRDRRDHRFGVVLRGYAPEEVDASIAELEEELAGVYAQRESLERDAGRLREEVERLSAELDASRAALPELEELHGQLKELRADYERRIRALELLLVATVREINERLSRGSRTRVEGNG